MTGDYDTSGPNGHHIERLTTRIDELRELRSHVDERLAALEDQRDALASVEDDSPTTDPDGESAPSTAREAVLSLVRQRDEAGSGANKGAILRDAEDLGFGREATAEALDDLRREGEVYEPATGHVRATQR